jgi:hypothetical protein
MDEKKPSRVVLLTRQTQPLGVCVLSMLRSRVTGLPVVNVVALSLSDEAWEAG